MQPEPVVDLAGHGPDRSPLHRPEDRVGRREAQEPEPLEQPVHVHRSGARLEPVVAHEQDQVLGTGSRDQAAEPVVEHPVDVPNPGRHRRLGELGVIGVVRGDVLRQAVLHAVGGEVHETRHPPVPVVDQPLHRLLPGRGHLHHLVEEGLRPVPVGGPRHPVDRPGRARLLQLASQLLGMGEGAPLRQHPSRDQPPSDGERRERQGDVHHERFHPRPGQVLHEGPLLDRAEGHGEPLLAPPPFEDVEHPVLRRVDAGQERGPRRPRMGRKGRSEHGPASPLDQRGQVGQDPPLQQRIQDAPVGAVPSDQENSRHVRHQGKRRDRGKCTCPGWGPNQPPGCRPCGRSDLHRKAASRRRWVRVACMTWVMEATAGPSGGT